MEPTPSPEPFGELRRALGATEQYGWRSWWARYTDHGGEGAEEGAGLRRPRHHRSLLVGAGITLLGAAAVVGVSAARSPRATAPPHEVASAPEPAVAPVAAEPVEPRAERIWPLEAPVVDGNVVVAGDRRWTIGAEGDVVAVGDWDCDGDATPAALRTATGAVFVFDDWAGPGEERQATRVAVSPGAMTLEPRGCGRAGLARGDGSVAVIDTRAAR